MSGAWCYGKLEKMCQCVLFNLYKRSLFNRSVCFCFKETLVVFLFIPCFSVHPGMFLLLLWWPCCYSQFIKRKKKQPAISLWKELLVEATSIYTLYLQNARTLWEMVKIMSSNSSFCPVLCHHVSVWFLQELILFLWIYVQTILSFVVFFI